MRTRRHWTHLGLKPIFQGRTAARSAEPALAFESIIDEWFAVASTTHGLLIAGLERKLGNLEGEVAVAERRVHRRRVEHAKAMHRTASVKERVLRSFPEYDTRPLDERGTPVATHAVDVAPDEASGP